MSYYVHSIDNQGLTVITAPPVFPTNQVGASETRQKHGAMTSYSPPINRWRLLIPSRTRTVTQVNPASAPREPHSNPRQEPPPRAALQVDNCTLSTVEHQGYGQGSVEAPVRADPTRGIGQAREPRRCHALGLTVDNVPDVIYCKAARGRQGAASWHSVLCAGYAGHRPLWSALVLLILMHPSRGIKYSTSCRDPRTVVRGAPYRFDI